MSDMKKWLDLMESAVAENDALTDPGRVLGLECVKAARKLKRERGRLLELMKEFKLGTSSQFYQAILSLNDAANDLDDLGHELRYNSSAYQPDPDATDVSGHFEG